MAEIYKPKPPPARDEENSGKAEKKKIKSKGVKKEVYQIVGKRHSPLSSYNARPKNARFQTQQKGEEIILLLRQHPITNIGWIFLGIILFFLPLLIVQFPFINYLPPRFQFVLILMLYMFVFAYLFENFLSWYFHVFIVTDRRVVDIDFFNLAYKEITDAKIRNIQDITFVMCGAIEAIFNYGFVRIQTAGQVPEIEFERVPQPDRVVEVLKKLQSEVRRKR